MSVIFFICSQNFTFFLLNKLSIDDLRGIIALLDNIHKSSQKGTTFFETRTVQIFLHSNFGPMLFGSFGHFSFDLFFWLFGIIRFDCKFNVVDNSIDFVFGNVGESIFWSCLAKRVHNDFAFAHEIEQFSKIVAIFLPNRIDNDGVHGLNPAFYSDFHNFLKSVVEGTANNLISQLHILQIKPVAFPPSSSLFSFFVSLYLTPDFISVHESQFQLTVNQFQQQLLYLFILPPRLMEEPRVELKTLIHHIMHRHNIYKMDVEQIGQVLTLLEEEPSEEPVEIQEKIFRGIIKFNEQYKDHVSLALNQSKFQQVPFEIKSLMHKLLHQFYFLNAIRAWEMFIPHFQQPGLQSQGHLNPGEGGMLNDQLEKARLHFMYYGPMSIYHFNQQLPPMPQPQLQSNFQPFFQTPQPDNFQNLTPTKPQRGRPPLNNRYKQLLPDVSNKNSSRVMNLTPLKKSQKQLSDSLYEPSAMISEGNGELFEVPSNKQQLNFDHCLCLGKNKSDKLFKCKCEKYYHPECVGSFKQCLSCRQAEYDPFSQVVWQLGTFPIDFSKKSVYEGRFSLSSHSNIFEKMEYAVMVSCAHPDIEGLCWPDDVLFKLNNQPVFQIPALLQAHSQKRRKDRQLFLNPYLAKMKNDASSLSNISFSLELLPSASDGLLRRNNRKGTFQLCFFIVKRNTPEELFRRVLDQYTKKPRIAPFDWHFYDEAIPDSLEITINDPYTSEMIDCPVRGVNCRHLQCFDLFTFLTMTYEANCREWFCPFCKADCRQLLIDKYQLFLLKELKTSAKLPKKITFYRDGGINYQKGQSSSSESDSNQPE